MLSKTGGPSTDLVERVSPLPDYIPGSKFSIRVLTRQAHYTFVEMTGMTPQSSGINLCDLPTISEGGR